MAKVFENNLPYIGFEIILKGNHGCPFFHGCEAVLTKISPLTESSN